MSALDDVRTFEELLSEVAGVGRWHAGLFCCCSIISVLGAAHVMVNIYFGVTPPHWCHLPEAAANRTPGGGLRKHEYIPSYTDGDGVERFDQCRRFELIVTNDSVVVTNRSVPCERWDYDYSESAAAATIVTEWDLVCGRRALRATDQAVFMFGILLGALGSGVLSDRFGRKRVLVATAPLFLATSGSVSLAGSYPVFIALRCLTAVCVCCLFTVSYVLLLEAFPPRLRGRAGMLYYVPSCAGHVLLALAAYLVPGWRQLQLVVTAPGLLLLLLPWLLDESPRWLFGRRRTEEVLAVLRKMARVNGRPPPDEAELRRAAERVAQLEKSPPAAGSRDGAGEAGSEPSDSEEQDGRLARRCGLLQLLATPRLRLVTLCSCWAWLVVSMLFFGITFNMADLSASRYVSLAVAAALEVPAYLVTVPLIDRLGRRPVTAALFLAAAVGLPAVSAVPAAAGGARVALLTAAKLAASAAFCVLYLYSAELFPTPLRAAGVGCSSTCARLGSMAAPYMVDLLTPLHWALPSVAFGVCAASAGLVVLLLPETLGRRLPETVRDVERRQCELEMTARS